MSVIRRVGCVSYLNAKPLIDGLDAEPDLAVRFDVPSALRADLASGEAEIALCPVFDYFESVGGVSAGGGVGNGDGVSQDGLAGGLKPPPPGLVLVPVGGIGCEGATLTVRLYSRVPIEQIDTVYADTDSHTSVQLLRVLLAELFGVNPTLIDYHAREGVAEGKLADRPEAMLLIGDKVVTASPPAVAYPYQLDLGEAWLELTGLPFVFAVWMARPATELGDLPHRLAQRLEANLPQRVLIAERYAAAHGWPIDLAEHYLIDVLRYTIGPRELEAIGRFGEMLAKHGLIRRAPAELDLWAYSGAR